METVYVLLATLWLKGGVIMTHSFSTPNETVCEQTKPLIKRDYEAGIIKLANTDLPVLKVVPICVRVSPV